MRLPACFGADDTERRDTAASPTCSQAYAQGGASRATLDEAIRTEAAALVDRLIKSVTTFPDAPDRPEVMGNIAD